MGQRTAEGNRGAPLISTPTTFGIGAGDSHRRREGFSNRGTCLWEVLEAHGIKPLFELRAQLHG